MIVSEQNGEDRLLDLQSVSMLKAAKLQIR